jgi:hypothetical protein
MSALVGEIGLDIPHNDAKHKGSYFNGNFEIR